MNMGRLRLHHWIPPYLLTLAYVIVVSRGGPYWQLRISVKWGEPESWWVSLCLGVAALLTWTAGLLTAKTSWRVRTFCWLTALVFAFLALDEGTAAQRRFSEYPFSSNLLPIPFLQPLQLLHYPFSWASFVVAAVVASLAVSATTVLRNHRCSWFFGASIVLIAAQGPAVALLSGTPEEISTLTLRHLAAVTLCIGSYDILRSLRNR